MKFQELDHAILFAVQEVRKALFQNEYGELNKYEREALVKVADLLSDAWRELPNY